MNVIFLAFANSQVDPLLSLVEEDDEVYKNLIGRSTQRHFSIHRDSHCTIPKIAEYLILLRDYLTVFHFSGHAGRDLLLLDDKTAGATGIAGLLALCPKLKLIVLNGCSTLGQVSRLLALENQPAVIATSAPVEDRTATQFSITFYQTLSEQHSSVEAAFEAGLNAARLQAGKEIKATRSITLRSEAESEEPVWGLFSPDEVGRQWALPTTPYSRQWVDFTPNEHLLKELIQSLAPFNEAIRKIVDDEDMGGEHSILNKRKAVLESLPHPLSEQIRKLLVPEKGGDQALLYDKLSLVRLRQIMLTYTTTIELVAFMMMAQLWDACEEKALDLPEEELKNIESLFQLNGEERKQFDFFPLIRSIRLIFEQNDISFFMPELKEIGKEFNRQSNFYSACMFMEAIRRKLTKLKAAISDQEIHQLCIIAEEKLATFFSKIGFIANYTITSVKNIDVINYRHLGEPRFKHKMVNLVQSFVGLAEEQKLMSRFMDNASVLITRKNSGGTSFLNLSPFVIDENAFDPKAEIAKLHFFEWYAEDRDTYQFKHVYKPDDACLVIEDQSNFRILKKQFDAFSERVFKRPIKDVA